MDKEKKTYKNPFKAPSDFHYQPSYLPGLEEKIERFLDGDDVKHFYGNSNKVTGAGKSYLHSHVLDMVKNRIPVLKAKNICDIERNIKVRADPKKPFLKNVKETIETYLKDYKKIIFLGDEIKSPKIFENLDKTKNLNIITGYQPEKDLGELKDRFQIYNIDPDLSEEEIEEFLSSKVENSGKKPEKYSEIIEYTSKASENFGEAELVAEKLVNREIESSDMMKKLAEDYQEKFSSREFWAKQDRERNFNIELFLPD
ncbi:MAG: hypothetical protein MUP58_03030 [Candidatus Nanohaloarchaeota archaeon QJJ-9]|nr:hypothetical protein [Candidatus Nanohaloarchaeota archaeon QJJ-9]